MWHGVWQIHAICAKHAKHIHAVKKVKKVNLSQYSLLSIGPGADPGVQAVSLQVTLNHPPSGRLSLLSARPVVTSVAFIHQMMPHGSTYLIPAYYLFIDPEKMKGWVGLVGRPVTDGLPTIVVIHQQQVERGTGKVCRRETDVLPLCNATNQQ